MLPLLPHGLYGFAPFTFVQQGREKTAVTFVCADVYSAISGNPVYTVIRSCDQ
jgi:hypothetical protein